jgi:hypothetical protein
MSRGRPRKSTSSRAIHRNLSADLGPASDYYCHNSNHQADVWAYQYNDPNELISQSGQKYSLNQDCYEPMCHSCHKKFDNKMDPDRHAAKNEKARQRIIAINKDPAYHEARVENSRRNGNKVYDQRIEDGTVHEWHSKGGKARHDNMQGMQS